MRARIENERDANRGNPSNMSRHPPIHRNLLLEFAYRVRLTTER